jgi:hypothetical protein
MKAVASVLVVAATMLTGFAGMAQAPGSYPTAFSNNMRQHCLDSCRANPQIRGREASCSSFCGCVVDETQRQIPLEVAMEAEKDYTAKQPNSPAVQRVRVVAGQCSGRYFPAPVTSTRR